MNHIKKSISIVGVAISSLVLFGGAINFLFDIGFSSLEPYLIIALIIFVLAYIFSILELKKLSVSATEKSYLEKFVSDFSSNVVDFYSNRLMRGAIPADFDRELEVKLYRHSRKHNELSNSEAEKAKSAFIKSCENMDKAFKRYSELNNNAYLFVPKILGEHDEEAENEYNIRRSELADSFTELRRVFKKAYPWLEWK